MPTFSGSSVLQLTDLLTSLQSWEFPICEIFPGKIISFLLFLLFFAFFAFFLLFSVYAVQAPAIEKYY